MIGGNVGTRAVVFFDDGMAHFNIKYMSSITKSYLFSCFASKNRLQISVTKLLVT